MCSRLTHKSSKFNVPSVLSGFVDVWLEVVAAAESDEEAHLGLLGRMHVWEEGTDAWL